MQKDIEFSDSHFCSILIGFSCGALSALAIWGKPPYGGDEFLLTRIAFILGGMVLGHLLYRQYQRFLAA